MQLRLRVLMSLETWQAHRAALHRFVLGRVGDRDTAEDIVHDVLLRGWAQREKLRDESKLLAWLHRMTRNAIVDHYRARRPSEELPEDLVAPGDETDAVRELASCLTPLIARLPESYRGAIELSEIEGLTQQETAQRLGISLSGAKSRVQRGRAKLQEMLLACCEVERDHRGAIVDYEPKTRCERRC
ncbi:MAG TPA: RNA polymerase sigma factor SigZ [Thermoanaerobaculia bacterium]